MFLVLLDEAAEKEFTNLRKRYNKEKQKIKKASKSGISTVESKAIKDSGRYRFLQWLDQYIAPRPRPSRCSINETKMICDDFVDVEDSICAPQHIDTEADNEGQIISNVTGHLKYSKKNKNMNSPDANENDVMKSLATIISKPKTEHVSLKQTELEDECDLFGKLVATQLRALTEHGRLNTQHKIQNIIFEARIQGSYIQR